MSTPTRFSLQSAHEAHIERLNYDEVELIGAASGRQYARDKQGRELQIVGSVPEWELENPPRSGEVRIEHRAKFQTNLMPFPDMRTTHLRAQVVPSGSYEQAAKRDQAREQARTRKANPRYRLVDALSRYPRLQRKAGELIHLTTPSDNFLAPVLPRVDSITTADKPQIRGFDRILAMVEDEARLAVIGDPPRLLLSGRNGRVPSDTAEMVSELEPYLLAAKLGDPIRCGLPHPKGKAPPAISVAVPSIPVCGEHLREELPE